MMNLHSSLGQLSPYLSMFLPVRDLDQYRILT